MLSAQQPVNTISQHRALSHEKAPLPQHFLALPRLLAADMDAGHKVGPQKLCQNRRIDFVRLHLRLRDDPRLERIGYRDVLLRPGVLDSPPLQHFSIPVDHAKHAVALVVIDPNKHRFPTQ